MVLEKTKAYRSQKVKVYVTELHHLCAKANAAFRNSKFPRKKGKKSRIFAFNQIRQTPHAVFKALKL